jgi:hypothetical protein
MRSFRTLLGGLLVATLATVLFLPVVPATAAPEPDLSSVIDRMPADVAEPPELSLATDAPGSRPVVFHATWNTDGAGINAPPSTIVCVLVALDPRPALVPTSVQATARVACNWPLPVVAAGVSLYRQGQNHSLASSVGTGFVRDRFDVSTFTPCQTSAYLAAATATVFFPPGYSPPVGQMAAVSNVVRLAATGTGAPPFTCERPPQPPPQPPPTPPAPGPAPVINNLHCEYTGANQFFCSLAATGWTQIRWTYNGNPRSAWNDLTAPPFGGCSGTPTIKVYVSNPYGSKTTQRSFRCEGPPL